MTINNNPPYILAVDDDSDLLLLFEKRLSARGFTVVTSLNGLDMWKIVDMKKPDVIFLDIQMEGISGIDICERLKADILTNSIPVVMLSACTDTAQRAQVCGADGFICKPYKIDTVVSEIERILS